jgi:hypothetical protein
MVTSMRVRRINFASHISMIFQINFSTVLVDGAVFYVFRFVKLLLIDPFCTFLDVIFIYLQ